MPEGFKDDLDEKASRVSEIGNALIKKILRIFAITELCLNHYDSRLVVSKSFNRNATLQFRPFITDTKKHTPLTHETKIK